MKVTKSVAAFPFVLSAESDTGGWIMADYMHADSNPLTHTHSHTHSHMVFPMAQKAKCRVKTDHVKEIRERYVQTDYDQLCQKKKIYI